MNYSLADVVLRKAIESARNGGNGFASHAHETELQYSIAYLDTLIYEMYKKNPEFIEYKEKGKAYSAAIRVPDNCIKRAQDFLDNGGFVKMGEVVEKEEKIQKKTEQNKNWRERNWLLLSIISYVGGILSGIIVAYVTKMM